MKEPQNLAEALAMLEKEHEEAYLSHCGNDVALDVLSARFEQIIVRHVRRLRALVGGTPDGHQDQVSKG